MYRGPYLMLTIGIFETTRENWLGWKRVGEVTEDQYTSRKILLTSVIMKIFEKNRKYATIIYSQRNFEFLRN